MLQWKTAKKILTGILVINIIAVIIYNRLLAVKIKIIKNELNLALNDLTVFKQENKLEGMKCNLIFESLRLNDSYSYDNFNKKYTIIFLFRYKDCSNCISNVIARMNSIYFDEKSVLDIISVCVDCDEANIAKIKGDLNIKSMLYMLSNYDKIKSYYGFFTTPILLFVNNKDKRICFAYLSKKVYFDGAGFFERVSNYQN